MINLTAVYVLWLRETKRFLRSKSRVVGSLAMPLMFLLFLGLGFRGMAVPGVSGGTGYLDFLLPGILGMSVIFTSMIAGISVLWDREFGFLKEIMVAPVDRTSIILGRIAGGCTTAIIQAASIMVIAAFTGFHLGGVLSIIYESAFIIAIAVAFIGLGLIFASQMSDIQGFNLIINLVIFPLFFLSGALFPISNLPGWLRVFSYLDPLTYGIDGLRGVMTNSSMMAAGADMLVLIAFAAVIVVTGAYLFEKSNVV